MILSRLSLVLSNREGTNRKACQPVKGSTTHDFYSLASESLYQKNIYIKPRKITEDLWASCALKTGRGKKMVATNLLRHSTLSGPVFLNF